MDPESIHAQTPLDRARSAASLGLPPARGQRFRLLRRILVRVNWFMVRHQLDYNLDVVRTLTRQGAELDVMRIQMDRMLHEMADHRNRVAQVLASMEASLRSEILGTDSREDQLERDVIRLYAMTAMLQQRLDHLSSGFAADESSDSGALTDGERSVTPIRHIASDRPS